MNETLLFYAMIVLFGLIYIGLALLPQKQIATKTDYFLAGRNLGVFKATCTLIATQLGAGLLLGTSQQAYSIGLFSVLFTVGISIGLVMLGCGIAGRLRALNIVTTTQLFETAYHSSLLRKIASLLVTFTLCGILVGNMVASKTLLTSLGFHNELFYSTFWLFIIVYTMLGGLHAVVLTDLFQVLFIIVTFVGIVLYSLWAYPPTFSWHALTTVQQQFKGHLPAISLLVSMLLMPALFALFEQDLAQIFFASKNKRVATVTAILTTIFMLTFGLIPIYLGMQAKVLGLVVSGSQSPLLDVIRVIAHPVMVIMAATGILAAIASTADALLCAIGANITQDFSLAVFGMSPLIESKVTILCMGLAILGLSFVMPTDVISILIRSYEIPVVGLLIPILAAYIFKQVYVYAAFCSLIVGLSSLALFKMIALPFDSLLALTVSLVSFFAGMIVQKHIVSEQGE